MKQGSWIPWFIPREPHDSTAPQGVREVWITLTCNALFMEYFITLLNRRMSRDVETTLLALFDANLRLERN